MEDSSFFGGTILCLVVGALAGYVVARTFKLDSKLFSAIGALVGFAGFIGLVFYVLTP